jgi:TonB-linked SusC/RagA family outer membrane protein
LPKFSQKHLKLMKIQLFLNPFLLRLMKISLLQAFLAVIFMGVSLAHDASSQELLKKRINLNVENQELRKVLHQIEKQTQVKFAYRPSVVSSQYKVSLLVTNETLEEVLQKVTKPYKIKYEIVDQQIILSSEPKKNTSDSGALEGNTQSLLTVTETQISGIVTDERGEGLPGVNVVQKGTQRGAVTDVNGAYSMNVIDDTAILVFSFVGYVSQEVPVGRGSKIDITLVSDNKSLDEVVVVGYGAVKKSDLTGAVGTIKGDVIDERPSTSLNQALGGRLAGVEVSVNSGRPGGRSNIRIRGNTSVSVANNPLYIIDGVILNVTGLANGSTPIDYIDPANIASIEVLKDASATAIYGARGANGVILVTTKGGSSNGNKASYDTYLSFGTLQRKLDLLNAEEFLRVEDIQYVNAQKYDPVGWSQGKYTDPKLKRTNPLLFDQNGKPLYDTDWQKEATQVAKTQSHNLSFTGGNKDGNYGIFLGYRNESGVMKESWLKRYSARLVLENKVTKWLTAGGSVSFNLQNENQIDPIGDGGIVPMRTVLQGLPIVPVKYPNGAWGSAEDYPGMEGGATYSNLVHERMYLPKTQTFLGNFFINLNLAEGLTFRSTFGANLINQEVTYYAGGNLKYVSRDQNGVASISNQKHNSWQFENQLNYIKTFSNIHSLAAMVGISWQNVDQFASTALSHGFSDDYPKFNNLGMGSNPRPSTSGASSYSLNSYFGRINYALKNRYLLTLTGRIDGSSKFGSENQLAFFPSAALGWKVTEEDFFKDNTIFSNLKLRTSFGMTGNSEIPNYQSVAGLGSYSAILGGTRNIGIGINRMANPTLQWEKNSQIDAGLEIGVANNKIMIEADVYRRVSDNMLLGAPVPTTSGYQSVVKNVGSMKNEGLEFAINTQNLSTTNLSWTTTFNISFNRNTVLRLTGGSDIITGSNVDGATIVREKEAVNSFFGLISLGTWGTHEEEEAQKYFLRPGDRKFKDVNGDGIINDLDRVIIGNGTPKSYGSFINNISYKNFDLVLDVQFTHGNSVSYMSKSTTEDRQGITNVFASVLNAWTPDNQNATIAELRPIAAGYNRSFSSNRIYDGSFLRGRNLLIGYNFPKESISKLKLSRLRLYASAQNFFLITKYPGYDPEVSTSANQFAQGMDFYSYPKPRVFTVGLNISL